MSTRYTAQEMREMASVVLNDVKGNDYYGATYEFTSKFDEYVIEEMLRQAAEDMEREEKREKRYEYAERYDDGVVSSSHNSEMIDRTLIFDDSDVVRREVGEWEEVTND